MKLKDLIKQLAEHIDNHPESLEYDVVLSLGHTDVDECTRVRIGIGDLHSSDFIVEHHDLSNWLLKMGYADMNDANNKSWYPYRNIVLLD